MSRANEFFSVLAAGDLVGVRKLLSEDAGLLARRSESGASPVLWCIYHGQSGAARLLVELGARINLFEAAALGDRERLQDRLEDEADALNGHSGDGFSALTLAAFFGHAELLELLLAEGADVNDASINTMRVTPLHSAVAHSDPGVSLQMTRELLKHGADPNRQQQGGYTPLHQAAAHGRADALELLIAHGADAGIPTEDGRTPRELAEAAGHTDIADRLP